MKKNFTLLIVMLFVFSINAQNRFTERTPFTNNGNATNTVRAQWDVLFTFPALEAASPGIETDGTNFYTTTWNAGNFHRYDMDGSNGVTFTIPGVSNVRDMAYDGQYFYGAAADMNLFQMDLANETLVSTITATCTGITGIRHIAYDPNLDGGNGGFWIGNWGELGAIKMDGSELVPNISGNVSCYGSAYDPWTDPSNPKLWLFQQAGGSNAVFAEFDINSQTFTGVTYEANPSELAGGACSYEANGVFILVGNIQTVPNTVIGYELAYTADPSAPAAPENFTAVPDATGAFTVQLDWTNPSLDGAGNALTELTSIDVYLDSDPNPIYTNNSPVIGGAESYTATLTSGGNHTFKVVGSNSFGTGIPATATVFVGVDVEVSDISGIPQIAGTDEVVSPVVTVKNNGVGTQSFDVTLSDGGAYSEVLSVTNLASGSTEVLTFPDWSSSVAGNFTFTATAADPGNDYDLSNNTLDKQLTVMAGCTHTLELYDAYGDGWNGNTASVTVDGTVVLDHITLATGFGPEAFTFIADTGSNIVFEFFADAGWPEEDGWTMYDGAGNVLFSLAAGSGTGDPVTETATGYCDTGAVNQLEAINISITPNPTNGLITVDADQNFNVEVFDISGRLVLSTDMSNNTTSIDISNEETGLYLVRLSNENGTLTYKVVKF